MSALDRAIEIAGGVTKLASQIGVTAQRLSNWAIRGVPAERCPDIERATKGAVRCEELRPDVAWDVLRLQSAPVEPVSATASAANDTAESHAAAREPASPEVWPLQVERRTQPRRDGPSTGRER